MAGTIAKQRPEELDGRQVFVNAPMSKGMMTFFTGAGDDLSPTPPATGRGDGQKIDLDFTQAETQTIELQFIEPIELHDGQMFYTPVDSWTPDDRFDFFICMSANAPTANPTTEGNCNLVDLGGYNAIVPAPGTGTHDLALSTAVPVEAADKDGYWDADRATGAITPNYLGHGGFNLLDTMVCAYFMRNMPMGHPRGIFDIDTYKSEWVHPSWKLKVRVVRSTTGSGRVSGWLMTYRKATT